MKFGDAFAVEFALIVIGGSITATDWFEVMSTTTIVFAESSAKLWSVDTFSNTFRLVSSAVDTTNSVASMDFEGTETALGSWPVVVVVSTFSVFNGFNIGTFGSAHVGISESI